MPDATVVTLLVVTIAVSFHSDYVVNSIDYVVKSLGISKTGVFLTLVPTGNVGFFHSMSLIKTVDAVTCVKLGYRIQIDLVVGICSWFLGANGSTFNSFVRDPWMARERPDESKYALIR